MSFVLFQNRFAVFDGGEESPFLVVDQLECEEITSVLDLFQKQEIAFPQVELIDVLFRNPDQLAFVAVPDLAGEIRAFVQEHVLAFAVFDYERDDGIKVQMTERESGFLEGFAADAVLGPLCH